MVNEMEALELEDIVSLLGVSDRMVRNYINDSGLPCRGDGRGRRFVWAEVREWFVAYRIELAGNRRSLSSQTPVDGDETLEEASLRKLKAEADLKELELATRRGEVVAVDDVKKSVERVAVSLKTAILAMPSKLSARLTGIKDRRQISATLTREAEELCRKLQHVGGQPIEGEAGQRE